MDLIVHLAKTGDESLAGLSANRESLFDLTKAKALREAMEVLLAHPEARLGREQAFLLSWSRDLAEASPFIDEFPLEDFPYSNAAASRIFQSCCQRIQNTLRDPSEIASAYKVLFLTGFISSRERSLVTGMLQEAREIFALEPFAYLLISDAIARKFEDFPYKPQELSREEREAALALACRMLTADSARHVHERVMFRLTLLSLEIPSISPARLAELSKQSEESLMQSLAPAQQKVALLCLMRMMLADRSVSASERQMLERAVEVSGISRPDYARLLDFAQIEAGKVIAA